MEERQIAWKKEQDDLSEIFRKLCKCRRKTLGKGDEDIVLCVAKKQLEFLTRVCREWKEIASVTRAKVFKETEQGEIDLFDIKCKEWGFLLKELFGSSLGTGDYGHLTIDHAPMLMRKFLSMTEFSQQGFEAAHKDQRQLWLKASSHDQHGEASSIDQMLVHFYSEKMLFFRYCVREALNSIKGKTSKQQNSYNFHFRGCGWKQKDMTWDTDEINWIRIMDKLMTMMFGGDFLDYDYDEKKICFVVDEYMPKYAYNRDDWLSEYAQMVTTSDDMCEGFEDVHLTPSHLTEAADNDKNVTEHAGDTSQSMQPSPETEDFVADDSTGLFVEVHDLDRLQVPSNTMDQDRVVAVFPPPPSVAKITVLQLDLNTLVDGEDLNDSIVDFFMMYLTANAMNQDLKNSQIFSSFFYTKLTERVKIGDRFLLPSAEERYKKASSFTRNIDLFEKDFIFMPVCRSGHWFLALIYNLPSLYDEGGMIFMIDSIVWSSEDDFFCSPSSREREAELIRSFIRCEWLAKRGTAATPEFSDKSLPLFYPKVPQQENGYDCGVFLLLFFEEFFKRKFPVDDLLSGKPLRWYNQSSALPLRKRITDILIQLGN